MSPGKNRAPYRKRPRPIAEMVVPIPLVSNRTRLRTVRNKPLAMMTITSRRTSIAFMTKYSFIVVPKIFDKILTLQKATIYGPENCMVKKQQNMMANGLTNSGLLNAKQVLFQKLSSALVASVSLCLSHICSNSRLLALLKPLNHLNDSRASLNLFWDINQQGVSGTNNSMKTVINGNIAASNATVLQCKNVPSRCVANIPSASAVDGPTKKNPRYFGSLTSPKYVGNKVASKPALNPPRIRPTRRIAKLGARQIVTQPRNFGTHKMKCAFLRP